jgi:hypothetical protein
VTPTLLEYYQQKNHQLTLDSFATFVTPYSMALVAEDVRNVFHEDEDFVNAVLMLVHQISYVVIDEGRYPAETLFENEGDCDLLSYVAASLTTAQGLDTVLFYYEHENHMNVGISLPHPPSDVRTTATYVDYGGNRYYMAECTGSTDDWQSGWRVGECPPELEDAQVTIVSLENCEKVAPGQVSSSFSDVESSVMSLSVTSSYVMEGSSVAIHGQVSVSNPEGTVYLYTSAGNGWFLIGESPLDSNGRYSMSWKPIAFGRYSLKASWPGDDERAGTDSNTISVYVIPKLLVLAFGGLALVAVTIIILFLIYRTTHSHNSLEVTQPLYEQAQA